MASDSLRALLSGLIDYAGLFPPAGLPLTDVVRNYAAYRHSTHRWALGRLVVPAAKLSELVALVPPDGDCWPVTALVGEDLSGDVERIAAVRDASTFVVQSAEVRATTVQQVRAAADALSGVREVYLELPFTDDLPALVHAVGTAGARAKLRTGGIVADAIPAPASVAQFIEACVMRGVAFKATAGLHHPIRGRYPLTYESGAPQGDMFGFLNVFLAAAFARGGMTGVELMEVLVESVASAFHFADASVTWRGHSLSLHDVESTRDHVAMSFGACSFREPIDDLRLLGLLTS